MNDHYLPEGARLGTIENREATATISALERAMNTGMILEGIATLCDHSLNLHVDVGGFEGYMPYEETVFNPDGQPIKDIAVISRVGKPICFRVLGVLRDGERGKPQLLLSRRAAQMDCYREFLSTLMPGDVIPAKVTHLESFGAFVDIGCGVISLLSVDCLSVSRINHPRERLSTGMKLRVVVKTIDGQNNRIFVSLRELLGTWEQNAALFGTGQTAAGIIRSVERYGVFVELTPNLAGLAELRPDADANTVARLQACIGRYTGVYIKSIQPDRMKIKLVLIDSYRGEPAHAELRYFIDPERTARLEHWRYSPESAGKVIETVF